MKEWEERIYNTTRCKSPETAKHRVLLMVCGSYMSKRLLAQAADAESCGQMKDCKFFWNQKAPEDAN